MGLARGGVPTLYVEFLNTHRANRARGADGYGDAGRGLLTPCG